MVYYNIIYFNTSGLDTVLLCSVHDVLYMCSSSNDHIITVNVNVNLANIIT